MKEAKQVQDRFGNTRIFDELRNSYLDHAISVAVILILLATLFMLPVAIAVESGAT